MDRTPTLSEIEVVVEQPSRSTRRKFLLERIERLIAGFGVEVDPFTNESSMPRQLSNESASGVVRLVNSLLVEIVQSDAARFREEHGYEIGATRPLNHICEFCWNWITIEVPTQPHIKKIELEQISQPEDPLFDNLFLFRDWPPSHIRCPQCDNLSVLHGRSSYCHPEGVVVQLDPFLNPPIFHKPSWKHPCDDDVDI